MLRPHTTPALPYQRDMTVAYPHTRPSFPAQSDITVLSTNAKASAGRAAEWASKRVFFCTPQVRERGVLTHVPILGPLPVGVSYHAHRP